MKKIIAFILIAAGVFLVVILQQKNNPVAAVVIPVDPERELYESIHAGKTAPVKPAAEPRKKQVAEHGASVVIEAHRTAVQKPRKVFSAARFVCSLPLENTETYTVVVNDAEDAAEAILKIKKEGCNEITIKSMPPAELYDAIVKTAKQHDVRVNA